MTKVVRIIAGRRKKRPEETHAFHNCAEAWPKAAHTRLRPSLCGIYRGSLHLWGHTAPPGAGWGWGKEQVGGASDKYIGVPWCLHCSYIAVT